MNSTLKRVLPTFSNAAAKKDVTANAQSQQFEQFLMPKLMAYHADNEGDRFGTL
jgi:hypothetical protein